MRFGVQDSAFRVWWFGCRVWGLKFDVGGRGLGFEVLGMRFGVKGIGIRDLGSGLWDWGSGIRVCGIGMRVSGFERWERLTDRDRCTRKGARPHMVSTRKGEISQLIMEGARCATLGRSQDVCRRNPGYPSKVNGA